jgi:chromosome segregation ATPase
MKRDNDNPISLFSFQDIITSLTGIMIIIILVIVLQLVETVSSLGTKIQADEEYLQWKSEVQALQSKLMQLQEADSRYSEEILKLFPLSSEDLQRLIKKEELLQQVHQQELNKARLEQENLNAQIAATRKESKDSQTRLAELLKEQAALQEALNTLTNQERDITRLLTAIEEGKRSQSKLEEQVKNLGTELEFSFPGTLQRHPLLIECLGDGFRAASYGQKDVQDFTQKGFSGNLRDLLTWLKTFDLWKTYPVLLYREDALQKHHEIEEKILNLSSGIRLGREPVAADSKIF